MRALVISDIHSNIVALESVIEATEFDCVLACGDIVGYYLWPNEVIDCLRSLGATCVLGNHDYASITGDASYFNPVAAEAVQRTRATLSPVSIEFLRSLPKSMTVEIGTKTVGMCHGSPRDPLFEYVYPKLVRDITFPSVNYFFMGHTHIPFSARVGSTTVANPGSVGQPRDGDPRASALLFDSEKDLISHVRVSYDIAKVRMALAKKGLDEPLGARLSIGR